MKKITAALLSLLLVISFTACGNADEKYALLLDTRAGISNAESAGKNKNIYKDKMNELTESIEKMMYPSGAVITRFDDDTGICEPQSANMLMRAYLIAKSGDAKASVKKYIEWYFEHMSKDKDGKASGTMQDLEITIAGGDGFVKESDITSRNQDNDIKTGTFLDLLYNYYKLTNDSELLIKYQYEIIACIKMLEAQCSGGISYSDSEKTTAVFENNCAAYHGFAAGYKLVHDILIPDGKKSEFKELGEALEKLLSICELNAEDMSGAIPQNFFNYETNTYKSNLSQNAVNNDIDVQCCAALNSIAVKSPGNLKKSYEKIKTSQYQSSDSYTGKAILSAFMGDYDAALENLKKIDVKSLSAKEKAMALLLCRIMPD